MAYWSGRGSVGSNDAPQRLRDESVARDEGVLADEKAIEKEHREERALLANLVESQQLGSAVKAVFDRNWQDTFQTYLSQHAQKKEADIKHICHTHYLEFIDSIDKLVTVKSEVRDLSKLIRTLNDSVSDSGEELVDAQEDLMSARYIRRNISDTLEALRGVQYVVGLAIKAREQIAQRKFFSALKILDQLQRVHLPRFIEYDFARHVGAQVPVMVKQIQDTLKKEFVDGWLPSIQSVSGDLGALAIAQMDKQVRHDDTRNRLRKRTQHEHKLKLQFDPNAKANAAAVVAAAGKTADGKTAPADAKDVKTPVPTKTAADSKAKADASIAAFRARPVGAGGASSVATAADLDAHRKHRSDGKSAAAKANADDPDTAADWDEESLFETVKVDFAPVYQYLHISEALGNVEAFKNLYKERRRLQCLQALEMGSAIARPVASGAAAAATDFVSQNHNYFANLAGFFIVEDSLMKSGIELYSRAEVDALWDTACAKVKAVCHEQLSAIQLSHTHGGGSASEACVRFVHVKYTLVLLAKTLASYGFFVTPIFDFLAGMRDKFEAILFHRLRLEIKEILANEKFESLTVQTYKDYQALVLDFGLQDASTNVDFPAVMPFSIAVPRLCRAITQLIGDYYDFAAHLPLELDVAVAKATDAALIKEVNASLYAVIEQTPMDRLQLSQVSQTALNLTFLAEACTFLEQTLASYYDANHPKAVQLLARDVFTDTSALCCDQLPALVIAKIDSIIGRDVAMIDWMATTAHEQPSEYVQDVVAYLHTTFLFMMFLTDKDTRAVHYLSCRHINGVLMGLFDNDKAVKKFNVISIYNLSHDVKLLEEFAARCPTPNLAETFTEIRQFIDLFLSGRVEDIAEKSVRDAKYSHLSPAKMVKILDKYKEIGLFSSLPKHIPNVKRKAVDTAIKALKALAKS